MTRPLGSVADLAAKKEPKVPSGAVKNRPIDQIDVESKLKSVDSTKQQPPKQEPPKQEQPKQEKPQQEKPKQEKPKQDKPKQEKPKQKKPQQDKPQQEKPQQDSGTNKPPTTSAITAEMVKPGIYKAKKS